MSDDTILRELRSSVAKKRYNEMNNNSGEYEPDERELSEEVVILRNDLSLHLRTSNCAAL